MSEDSRREVLEFFTNGLLSKWGFGDGDMLDDLLWDNGFGNVWEEEDPYRPDDAMWFDHRVLVRVVREHVIPEVRQHHDIEVYDIHTIHNPIRASRVDGVEVNPLRPEEGIALATGVVSVPASVILAIASHERDRFRSPTSGDNE